MGGGEGSGDCADVTFDVVYTDLGSVSVTEWSYSRRSSANSYTDLLLLHGCS